MNRLCGTGVAIKLVLRRDRIALPIWIVVLAGFVISAASTFAKSYPTPAARATFAASIQGNPAMNAVYGRLLSDSIGGLTTWRVGVAGALLYGIFSLVTVLRHTRGEEEAGRTDLLRSGAVGRYAQLAAALTVTMGAHLLIGILVVAGLQGQGLAMAGSVALAAGLVGVGAVLATAAALTAQLSSGVRAATGITAGFFALVVALRMAGEAANSWLLWMSPLGWSQLARPFAGERWSVFLLPVIVSAVLAAVAFTMSERRDLGSGVLAPRPGPAHAGPRLVGPLALAWRLHRGTLLAVSLGCALLGLLIGGVASSVGTALGTGSGFAQMLAKLHTADPGEALLQLLLYALAEIIGVYVIIIALRPRAEENSGTAAPLLVAGVNRTRWLGSHLVFAALAPAVCLLVLGAAAGLGYAVAGGPAIVGTTIVAALAKLPAVWVLAGVTTALFGLAPRFALALSWTVFGLVELLELAWESGAINRGVFEMSPFAHVYPGDPVTAGALLGLTALGLFLTAVGTAGLRRRDLA